MSTVYVVRHAMPDLVADLPPARWRLSADGRRAATALAGRWPSSAAHLVSDEVKAQETVRLAAPGAVVRVDPRLGEVRRPAEPIGGGVRVVRRAWVAGMPDERHAGWEPMPSVAGRVEEAVRDAPAGDVVLGTHGMALTAWLVARGVVAPGEAAAQFWERLPLPAVITCARS